MKTMNKIRKSPPKIGELLTFASSGNETGNWIHFELDGEDDNDPGFEIESGTSAVVIDVKPIEDELSGCMENIEVLVEGIRSDGWFREAFVEYRREKNV